MSESKAILRDFEEKPTKKCLCVFLHRVGAGDEKVSKVEHPSQGLDRAADGAQWLPLVSSF